ncbi:Ycf66 family protein [Aetokthonos hydrillicola Thurmond2011]|jgi:hypothetical protein|uniref:Ycf66 family protein n=1 Tax=Aetokthonos hydrillicola Thurmond2011 TaxID=2712845 RepID=A0AAP5I2M4_9CYAN|nr:Ycf66 family protein [Aetokthonos hydrillicola]MBO3462308.1 hypothetical protein [Aetokthonos hydrillicola CCALA 1050]MBW4590819.1 Ycf66 family protein [Aetokthonos hydrillicola CCALA 1050]MDR9893636.1 Ycf66 family protein [Aetokthonos hydrillicola Thurmond2011]
MVIFGLHSASVLAQVNFGTNPASLLGIFLAVAGPALYFIRFVRPGLERDQDIFFAAIGLVCGFILIFQGWRLDPILQFGQLLLIGTTVFFAVESLRLRMIATDQAKRNTKIVDEREVSDRYEYSGKRYEAEVDAELEPLPYEYEDRPVRARIPGSRESRSRDNYRDSYYDDEPRRRSDRRSSSDRPTPTDKTRRRNSGGSPSRTSDRYDNEDWGSSSKTTNDWDSPNREERRTSRRSSNEPFRPDGSEDEGMAPKPRKRRPSSDSATRPAREDDDAVPTDYVEYKPITRSDDDLDNPPNYDNL